MKKILRSPLLSGLLAFFAALVGFFLRSIQLRTELLADGSLAEGSYLHILLLALSGLCVAVFALALSQMEKESGWQRVFSGKPLPNTLQIVSAIVLLTGNVILLLQGGPAIAASRAPAIAQLLSRLEAPLGLLAALCLILFTVSCLQKKKPSPLFYMGLSLYLTVRLIAHFQIWNTDPSIQDYLYQLLATICCMLGTFHLAGFSFDKGKRRVSLFWTLCAVVFCAVSAADMLYSSDLSGLMVTVSLLLTMTVSSISLLFCKEA